MQVTLRRGSVKSITLSPIIPMTAVYSIVNKNWNETSSSRKTSARRTDESRRYWVPRSPSALKETCRGHGIPVCDFDLDFMDSRIRSVESIRSTIEEFFEAVMD